MTAPTAPHTPPPATPTAPPVRVEVRVGPGHPAVYEFSGVEFLVGGAGVCDVRLPGAGVPPLVCQFARTPDGIRLRRLAPAFPILLNGDPVAGTDPIPVPNGAAVAVGPVDIRVTVPPAEPIRPTFVRPSAVTVPAPSSPTVPEADLLRMRADLEEQARELEADRVLWYRRRREIEDECRRLREEAAAPSARETELDARERDLARVRDELAALREDLAARYHDGRAELAEMQDLVRGAAAELDRKKADFEAEMARRRGDLEAHARGRLDAELRHADPKLAELRARRDELDAAAADLTIRRADFARDRDEFARDRAALDADRADLDAREAAVTRREGDLAAARDEHAADLVRVERWQASLADRQTGLDRRAAEIDARFDQLKRDTLELEDHVRLADAEHARLAAEADRLDKLRTDLDDRAAKVNDRAAHLEAQQAMLAVLRARLDRQAEDARREAVRLAADRGRLDASRAELEARLREAEHLRSELLASREGDAEQRQHLAEQAARMDATLAEVRDQQDTLAAEHARLRATEDALDARSAEIAEQAAVLKARVTQAMDLQARLEADRAAVRQRETTLSDAEAARVAFQEQLRRRAEDLSARAKLLDDATATLAADRAAVDAAAAEFARDRDQTEAGFAAARTDLDAKLADLDRQTAALAEREAALERQVARLQDVGRGVAAARKELAAARTAAAADRADADAHRTRVAGDIDRLRAEAPELEARSTAAIDRLAAARDVLRGQLAELHEYAAQARADLASARSAVAAEADGVRTREQLLDQARAEHRLAVAQFRQQLVEWHAKVSDLKKTMARSETRIDARHAEVAAASEHLETTTQELAKQAEELRAERQRVAERRADVERHLADMREWYRTKLRDLAARSADPDAGAVAGRVGQAELRVPDSELDDGDRQLGDLLRSLDLVDADTLAALWAEATARRRTLRQVLLASGAVTLYQLALIEAGNLDGLMLGRFRVVDRVRVTPHETAYRAFDPTRGGTFLLRVLSEADAHDAVLPDEFRQRFAAARDAAHPNLAGTVEVLDAAGRPAVLQEWVAGTPGSDWPAAVAVPGVWVRLFAQAAAGLAAAHGVGLGHGRLVADAFLLTPDGTVKLTGVGEPGWLTGAGEVPDDPAADLRSLGQIAFGWSQIGANAKKRGKAKGFPEPLLAVVRRLEADGSADAAVEPYPDAAALAADLARLESSFPCPAADWDRLLRDLADGADAPLRQSA